MNHELTVSTLSEPVVGDPLNRGAFVSKLTLDARRQRRSRASGPTTGSTTRTRSSARRAEVGNTTRGRSRASAPARSRAREHGFDRHIYFTNEEEGTPANTFDGEGGLAVAIFDNNLHTLPKLGRFAWENTLVQPKHGQRGP